MSQKTRIHAFVFITLAASAFVFFLPPIPQDPRYHMFADTRAIFGIPNFSDVASNLFFLIAGIWGLRCTLLQKNSAAFREKHERWPYIVFFLGFALTSLGSAIYHLSPTNSTLALDRLPMAIVCMAVFAGTLNDRIGARVGTLCLGPMLAFGSFSVAYWYFTESNGSGDLRPYVLVQFFTLAAILILVLLFPARYTHSGWLLAGGTAYLVAKLFEKLDEQLFSLAKISGHTLKHLFAALAAVCVLQMLIRRRSIGSGPSGLFNERADKAT